MVERVTRHLSERIGEQWVAAHHGSLAKEQRFDAETRLKNGQLKGAGRDRVVGTRHRYRPMSSWCASLGTPRAISTFLQRVGRANHAVGGVPKGRLLPLSRDELVRVSTALARGRARR